MRALTHYEQTWPHPKNRPGDPVDPRLSQVIRRALRTGPTDPDRLAHHVALKVWAWLAEGD